MKFEKKSSPIFCQDLRFTIPVRISENKNQCLFFVYWQAELFYFLLDISYSIFAAVSFTSKKMSFSFWIHLFQQQLKETSWIEWLAVAFGVAEVLLARANKVALYPAGIAGTILSIYLFVTSGLYAESLLNLYYVIMSVYGWWYWIKKKNAPAVPVSYANKREWFTVTFIVAGGFIFLYFILKNFTPSTVPFWDAFVSATAWAGMWLLAKRKIENWILLNISNAAAIPLLFYKHLILYAALTIFLFIIAIQGFFEWRKIIKKENNFAPNPL